MATEDFVWKFGYGSNMSPTFMSEKKGVPFLAAIPAKLEGWQVVFTVLMSPKVEPSFASVYQKEGFTTHGLATKFTKEAAAKMDQEEGGDVAYDKKVLMVTLYTGEQVMAEVYVSKKNRSPEEAQLPSRRYLQLMIDGAREINLEPRYIEWLQTHDYYKPSAETLAARAALPKRTDLPKWSIEQLREYNGSDDTKPVHVSACGYIVKCKPFFRSYWGRDMTNRCLLHHRGISVDANDDKGTVFPVLAQLPDVEREYAHQHLDQLVSMDGAELVAHLGEFEAAQNV